MGLTRPRGSAKDSAPISITLAITRLSDMK